MAFLGDLGFNPTFSPASSFGTFLRIFGGKGNTRAFANAGQNPKTGVVPSGAAREQFIRNEKIRAQNAAIRLSVKPVTDRFAHAANLARGTVKPGARSASSKALVAGPAVRKAARGTPPAGNRPAKVSRPTVSKPASTGVSRKAAFRASVRARFARFGNRRTR